MMKVSPEFQGNCQEIERKIVLFFVVVVALLQIVVDLKKSKVWNDRGEGFVDRHCWR